MEKEGAKCVEIKGLDDKRQLRAVFGGTISYLCNLFTKAKQANAIPIPSFLKIGALLILTITGAMKQL